MRCWSIHPPTSTLGDSATSAGNLDHAGPRRSILLAEISPVRRPESNQLVSLRSRLVKVPPPEGGTAHSQITRTLHPPLRNASLLRASLTTFARNFFSQNAELEAGVAAILQPSCRCQKQPWTKITAFHFLSTMSGLPGSVPSWIRNRKPARWRMDRTAISGRVSLLGIADIILLRVARSTVSIN